MAGKSKSAKFYQENPESRRKKQAYDKKLNSDKKQIQKRVESNRARRQAKAAGKNVDGKDWDHSQRKFVKSSINRGRGSNGGGTGDRNARQKGAKRKPRK